MGRNAVEDEWQNEAAAAAALSQAETAAAAAAATLSKAEALSRTTGSFRLIRDNHDDHLTIYY